MKRCFKIEKARVVAAINRVAVNKVVARNAAVSKVAVSKVAASKVTVVRKAAAVEPRRLPRS